MAAIDWAALPSGFRERFFILAGTGVLFSSYFPSTTWYLAFYSLAHPGAGTIMVPGVVSNLSANLYSLPLFFCSVIVFYAVHPFLMKRRLGEAKPLDPGSTLGLICGEMAKTAGLPHVRFLVTKDMLDQGANAFGLPFRRYVYLGGGMRVVAAKAPDLARAVVAHEIGHLKHGDVDLGFLSRAVIQAMAVVAVVTVFIVLAGYYSFLTGPLATRSFTYMWRGLLGGTVPVNQALGYTWGWIQGYNFPLGFVVLSFLFFIVLTWGEYAALLRSREHYADITAARWLDPETIGRLFKSRREIDKVVWGRSLVAFFRFHPTASSRAKSLFEPWRVVRPRLVEAFAAGFIGGAFYCYLSTYTSEIRPNATNSGWVFHQAPPMRNASEIQTAIAQDPLVLVGVAAMVISWVLWLSILGSQNLRMVTLTALRMAGKSTLAVISALLFAFFLLGLAAGDRLNPVSLYTAWNQWPVPGGVASLAFNNWRTFLLMATTSVCVSFLALVVVFCHFQILGSKAMGPFFRGVLVGTWMILVLFGTSLAWTIMMFLTTGDEGFLALAKSGTIIPATALVIMASSLVLTLWRRGSARAQRP
jgi:Zn-dependent protease with chaperone function